MSKLIKNVRERQPIWDHRIPVFARFQSVKRALWTDIYAELKG